MSTHYPQQIDNYPYGVTGASSTVTGPTGPTGPVGANGSTGLQGPTGPAPGSTLGATTFKGDASFSAGFGPVVKAPTNGQSYRLTVTDGGVLQATLVT